MSSFRYAFGIIICMFFLDQNPVNAQQWELQTTPSTENLWDVNFSDANAGVAVGDNGVILNTINGGTSWISRNNPSVARLNGVYFTDNLTGTAVGFLGAIIRTTNGGMNWNLQNSGTSGVLDDVYFFDTNNGIVSHGGDLLRTIDGGQTWTSQTVDTVRGLTKIAFADSNTGVILAGGDRNFSYYFRTTDGGQTWTEMSIAVGNGFNGVSFGSNTTGTVVGPGGKIYRTTDAGLTWFPQSSGTAEVLFDVSCTDVNNCTAVGVNGIVLRTEDGGTNWITESNPLAGGASLYAVWFVDAEEGWAAGSGGNIIHRTPQDTTPGLIEQKLTHSNQDANDNFGISVSISEKYPGNQYVVIGASGDNANEGSTYIYEIVGMGATLEHIAAASDGEAEDRFGCAVAVDSFTALVGAVGDDDSGTNAGAAYIFRNNFGWFQDIKLTSSDGAASDSFGFAVGIFDDYAIVGAPGDNNTTGAAYIYKRDPVISSQWLEVVKLTASDAATGDRFGSSVDLHGNYAIVGASRDDVGVNADQGSVYIFMNTEANWVEQAKLTASDGAANDLFGVSVSIFGDRAIVGAENNTAGAASSGAAYTYELLGGIWTEQAKLSANDGATSDYFGASVSISGDYTVISAPRDDDNGAESGSAYRFERDISGIWGQETKLTASDGTANDEYGTSVSIAGEIVIVGAPFDDDEGQESGAAYLYFFPVVDIGGKTPALVTNFALEQNYPNPFNPTTTISFQLPGRQYVSLKVYDITGKEITTLINKIMTAGAHQVQFNAENLASGIYLYQLSTSKLSQTRKMMLVK